MIHLQEYLCEAKMDPAVSALISSLRVKTNRTWYIPVDTTMLDNIKSTFTQVDDNDVKGRQWKLVLDNNYDGNMIMVSIAKGEWRNALDKDLYNKSDKNAEKDFMKEINRFGDFEFGEDFGIPLYFRYCLFLFRNYKKVLNAPKHWRRAFLSLPGGDKAIRFDVDSRKWGFDKCDDAELMCKVSYSVASNYNLPEGKPRYHTAHEVVKYVTDNFERVRGDYDKNLKWCRIGNGAESNDDIMVCLQTKQWRDLSWNDTSNESVIVKELKKIRERDGKYGTFPLSLDCYKYIKDNYDEDTVGVMGKWYAVYYNDPKYGRFMINIDKKLWRKPTFDEFYGGGVVD